MYICIYMYICTHTHTAHIYSMSHTHKQSHMCDIQVASGFAAHHRTPGIAKPHVVHPGTCKIWRGADRLDWRELLQVYYVILLIMFIGKKHRKKHEVL